MAMIRHRQAEHHLAKMDKIGWIILCTVWIVSYYLKHINHIVSQLVVDYYITFGYCIGTGLIALYYGLIEKNKRKKHLFYYAIVILNFSIVATYLIDFIAGALFGTTKVIWAILITTFLTLCIYLFKVRL